MRNLKKILALVLALVMSFSLMATANAFTDSEKVTDTYETAVTVLDGLKVFQGYDDGSFQPQGSITRAEVAAIIYRIVTGDVTDTQVGIYADYNKFDDVKSTSWYAGYVNFCANAEYIKGYDAKTFGPNDPVTGYQALAMILRALGYDKNGEFTGTSWQVQTAATGELRGITKNISAGTLGTAASREVVAEILFRAILVDKVNYTPAFGYQLDDTSIGWDTFELEEITGVVIANEYADLYSSKPAKAGETELNVDGDIYTLSYATTLEDIGEARNAYITEGENVLYIADAGNTVFETGAKVDIGSTKKFENATGLELDEDVTEKFVNFDNTTYEYVTDIRISYWLDTNNNNMKDAADETGVFAKGTELTSAQVAILEGIFKDDAKMDGWVVVGTKDLDEANDISNDITWKAFCKEYFTESDTQIKDVTGNENGNWLKVIDNDGDGVADYVLKTIYTMAGIEDIAKDGTITLSCDEVNLNDGDAVNYVDEDIDVVAEDDVEEDDIVYYAVIDGNAYTYLAEVVTAEIDKVNRNTLTATTTDGDEYVESGVHNHIIWNGYVNGVKNLEGDINYSLYLDKYGYLAAFTESVNNAGFVLITDGWYNETRTNDEYAAMVWNGEELVDTDITDGGELFIYNDAWTQNNSWGNLREFVPVNCNGVDDDIHTIVAALDEDGTLIPVDDLYRYREEVVMVEMGETAAAIPDRSATIGTIYASGRVAGEYSAYALDMGRADVRALSSTIYYYVYNTDNGTVVREYVGYDDVPSLGNDAWKVENVYAVASRATDANANDYYTAEIVVVELRDGYAELDAEEIFLVDLPEALNSVGTELARVIRADGTEAEVMIDLDKSELWADEYREYDPAWGKYIVPGLYYMWESADEADVYVIERMSPWEIAESRYLVGTVNKSTATSATNWTSVDTYELNIDPVDPLFNFGSRPTGFEDSAKNVDESNYYTLSYDIDNWEQWINGSASFDTNDYSAALATEDRDTVMAQSVKGQDANYVLVRYNSDDEVVYAISFRYEDNEADKPTADDYFTEFVWVINTPIAYVAPVPDETTVTFYGKPVAMNADGEFVDAVDYSVAKANEALDPDAIKVENGSIVIKDYTVTDVSTSQNVYTGTILGDDGKYYTFSLTQKAARTGAQLLTKDGEATYADLAMPNRWTIREYVKQFTVSDGATVEWSFMTYGGSGFSFTGFEPANVPAGVTTTEIETVTAVVTAEDDTTKNTYTNVPSPIETDIAEAIADLAQYEKIYAANVTAAQAAVNNAKAVLARAGGKNAALEDAIDRVEALIKAYNDDLVANVDVALDAVQDAIDANNPDMAQTILNAVVPVTEEQKDKVAELQKAIAALKDELAAQAAQEAHDDFDAACTDVQLALEKANVTEEELEAVRAVLTDKFDAAMELNALSGMEESFYYELLANIEAKIAELNAPAPQPDLHSVMVKGVAAEWNEVGDGSEGNPFQYVAGLTQAQLDDTTEKWIAVEAEVRSDDVTITWTDGTNVKTGEGYAEDGQTDAITTGHKWVVVCDDLYYSVTVELVKTAQELIDEAQAGETVVLPAGTYGNLNIKKNITIDGSEGAKITGKITVQNASVTNVTIKNCEIVVSDAAVAYPIVSTVSSGALITITGNTFVAPEGQPCCALYLDTNAVAGIKYIITDNIFVGDFREGAIDIEMQGSDSKFVITGNDFTGVTGGAYVHVFDLNRSNLEIDFADDKVVGA